MYLVELRPGKEELYRSGDELAAAIRSGDVDGHSRIYHRATSKWISITLHPQYKAIVSQKSAEPLPPMERSNWTYLNAQSETLEGAAPDPETPGGEEPSPGEDTNPWRRPMALSITGLLLVLGVQVSFSGPRPPWAARSASASAAPARTARPVAAERERNASRVVSLASSSAAWDRPEPAALPAALAAKHDQPVLPRAPRLRAKALGDALPEPDTAPTVDGRTIEGLLAGYAAAYDSARGRLATGMRVTRLDQLFAAARLQPNGGLTETRLALAGASNFIRVYRQQEAAIEREFQDSFTVTSQGEHWKTKDVRRWYSRPALKEPAVLASLTGSLLGAVDSVLGVLDDQAGAYELQGDRIRFEEPAAARQYGELRRHIAAAMDSVRVAGGAEPGTPMAHLLQAIGATRLPREL